MPVKVHILSKIQVSYLAEKLLTESQYYCIVIHFLNFSIMSNIYSQRQQWILLIVSIVMVGLFVLYGIHEFISAFLGSTILYMVFRPTFNDLVHKKRYNRIAVTTIIIIFSLVVIVLPFLILSVMLANKIIYYSKNTEEIVEVIRKIEDLTGLQLHRRETIQTLLEQSGNFVAQLFPSFVGGAVNLIVIVGLLYFALYYMFVNEEQFIKGVYKYLPFDPQTLDELGEELRNMVNANVIGQGMISLIQGGLTGLGFYMFGFDDPFFWGTIAFFMSFVPVLGTPLVWGPAGILAITQDKLIQGIGLLVYGSILVVNIDNVLRLVLAKKMGDVHPLITLTGIVLGVPLFGILGLVIGPLLIDYFIVLFKVFERQNRFHLLKNKEEIISPHETYVKPEESDTEAPIQKLE